MNLQIKKPARKFLKGLSKITAWENLEPFFKDLAERKIKSVNELERWILDRSELEAVIEEDMAWRFIRMTCDTSNKDLTGDYTFFVEKIEPKIAPFHNLFNRKLLNDPFLKKLNKEKYNIYLRGIKREIEVFREKNIPLLTKVQTESQKYAAISGAMTINENGKDYTLPQAAVFLKDQDRNLRERIYNKIQQRKKKDQKKLDALFSKLVSLRNKIALNAGFKNYRDYKFAEMGRFDYTPADCFKFHKSVDKHLMPLINKIDEQRKKSLGLKELWPWDMEVDITGKPPLTPYSDSNELKNKTIACFKKIRPAYSRFIQIMDRMKHFDLESRIGKAPGGYNYPLYETGVPFIFMNSAGTLRDLVTMVHEGGHAIHSFLSRDLEITGFKNVPSEVAELASMSMELISMEHWEIFFKNQEELKRAKKEHLEKIFRILPWIAAIDKFQHWIYTNPDHSVLQRTEAWKSIISKLNSGVITWKGNEDALERMWQGQLHIFEIPFYYIEYGMAQLGALAIWKNYKKNPAKTLDQYEAALKLGYTRSIKEIYKTAGIQFDFSEKNIKKLAGFLKKEIETLC